MTLSIGNDYYVIFLPKWRTQIWGKIDLGVHRFECEAIPKDTDLRGKRTRIWGYSNFIGLGFAWKTQIWGEDTDLRTYNGFEFYIFKGKIITFYNINIIKFCFCQTNNIIII
jgi:hypothetical protein